MSAQEIYKRHKSSRQYNLVDLNKWDKAMVKLTDNHRQKINKTLNLPSFITPRFIKKTVKSRGKLFRKHNLASNILVEDTKNGSVGRMKPKKLWKSRKEHWDFLLEDFRKHIYQRRYRQLSGPYWQKNDNTVLVEHEKVKRVYQEWHHTK